MRSDIRIRIRRTVIRIRIPTCIRLIIRITTEDQSKELTTFNILNGIKIPFPCSFYRAERRAPKAVYVAAAPLPVRAYRPAVAPLDAVPPKIRAHQPDPKAGAKK